MRFSRKKNIDKQKTNNDSKKIFVDREQYTRTFNSHLLEAEIATINKNGMLLTYSGVGGVGKSALLKQFEEIAQNKNKKFVYHDFKLGSTEMPKVLKSLCEKLSDKYQMDFPLFDKGCIYLAQKNGDFVTAEQQKAVLESSSLFRSFKKNFSKIGNTNDRMAGVAKIIKPFLEDKDNDILEFFQALGQGTLEANPVLKFIKSMLDLIDKKQARREEEARKNGNEDYKAVADELENLNEESNSAFIEEFLPTLFAQDISFWLEKNNTDLIIFLDTYEKLTGEESGKKKTVHLISEDNELVPIDWWIGELLLTADRVMWVIAGRYEINEIGDADLEKGRVKNYTLDSLDKDSINKYLDELNFKEEHIRNKIIEVTGGLPYYIYLCCNVTYKNKFLKGEDPDFGENLEEVVERAIGSFDENSRALLQKLCILGRWTGEIFRAVIPDYNPNVYKRLKSILVEESFADLSYGKQEKIYSFDRTISSFLLPSLKQDKDFSNYFTDIRNRTNAYFKKLFKKEEHWYFSGSDYYFDMWSDIILRTTDSPAELMKFYEEYFDQLEYHFDNSTRANVLQKFIVKVGNKEPLPHAYFQDRLARLRLQQNKIKEAFELEEAAYLEIKDLSLSKTDGQYRVWTMWGFATVLNNLKRYKDEIKVREEMDRECEYCLSDDIDAMVSLKKQLMEAYESGDRKSEAIRVCRQILKIFDALDEFDNFIDGQCIKVAEEFKFLLELDEDYETKLSILRKLVAFYEKTDDELMRDLNLQYNLRDLIETLGKFSGQEYLEEKARRYRQYINLCEKNNDELVIFNAISDSELKDFADTLEKLGRYKEAANILKKLTDNSARQAEDLQRRIEDLKYRIKSVDKPDAETVDLMLELVSCLYESEEARDNRFFDDEAPDSAEVTYWKEKIKESVRAIIEQTCCEPIKDYHATLSTLGHLAFSFRHSEYNKEEIQLLRKILEFTEKNPDANEEEIIYTKKNLLESLSGSIRNPFGFGRRYKRRYRADNIDKEIVEECNRLFEEIEGYYKKDLPTNRESFLYLLREYMDFLVEINDTSVAIKKFTEIINLLKEDSKTPANEILYIMERIAAVFEREENYSEEAIWREDILKCCQSHFVENAPEILEALENLISVYQHLDNKDKIAQYSKKLNNARETNLGSSHIDVIRDKEELAYNLHNAGNFNDEISLREKIINLYRENFRTNPANKEDYNSDFIRAMENLADIFDETGQKERALEIRKQIVSEQKEYLQELKENSTDLDKIADEMSNLACALENLGECNEAMELREQIIKFYRENFRINPACKEDHHWKFVYKMKDLANCLDKMGQEKKALGVRMEIVIEEKESLQKVKENFAEDYDIISGMDDVIRALQEVGDYEEELRYRRELVDFCKAKDRKSDDTLRAMENLVEAYSKYDKTDDAIKIYNKLAEIYSELLEEKKISGKYEGEMYSFGLNLYSVKRNLLKTFECLGDKEKANELCKEIIDDSRRFIAEKLANVSETNEEILHEKKYIAYMLEKLGNYKGALEQWQEILRLLNKKSYKDSWDILNAEKEIANLLFNMGEFDNALSSLMENYNQRIATNEVFGDLPEQIADTFAAKGDYEQALIWRRKVVELKKVSESAILALADTLDKLNRHNEATAERIQLLEKFKVQLENIIDIYGADNGKIKLRLKRLAKIRDKISGDTQALETFNRLFEAV